MIGLILIISFSAWNYSNIHNLKRQNINNVSASIIISYRYGPSPIHLSNLTVVNSLSLLTNQTGITAIEAKIRLNYIHNETIKESSILGNLFVQFDGITKEKIPLVIDYPNSPTQIASTKLFINNITSWDLGRFQNHTLSFKIPSNVTYNFRLENNISYKVYLNSSEYSIPIIVSPIENITRYYISNTESNIIIKSSNNRAIILDNNFGDAINSLNNVLKKNDKIYIQKGTYIVSEPILITQNAISIQGETETTLTSSTNLSSYILKITGDHDTIQSIIFDANHNNNISPVVMVTGDFDLVRNCTFTNAIQYSLLAFSANHFKIIYNNVEKAQYGISTGGGNGYPFSQNGLIAHNTIKDCRDCCVKLRWCNNVTVENNLIDIGYLTWGNQNENNGMWGTSVSSDNPVFGCEGIKFYQADGPDINCTVKNNIIYDSNKTAHTCGIEVGSDFRLDKTILINSSGQILYNNTVSDAFYGIIIKSPKVLVGININDDIEGNEINNSRNIGILLGWTINNASNSKVIGNLITNSSQFGIEISNGTNNCIISKNIIKNSGLQNIKDLDNGNIIN